MSEENNKSQNESQPRRFNQEQYNLLKKCSDKKDFTEWDEYRTERPDEDIELEGADLNKCYLVEANLASAYLKDANLKDANLEGANLDDAELWDAHLGNACLACAGMVNAILWGAHLEGTLLAGTHLEGADLWGTYLEGACFSAVVVDGATSILGCRFDRKTDFRETGLDNIRALAGTKYLLKYNIRRMNWEDWYKEHKILKWPVLAFWQMSDYGNSTLRIILGFFGLAFGFAIIYRIWPELVMVRGGADHLRDFIHALYFSVVTMTTLGFGDIAANPDSHCGQILLMVQVILGYVLLGALITRLAVLFTGEGPAGEFADEKKKEGADNGNGEIS